MAVPIRHFSATSLTTWFSLLLVKLFEQRLVTASFRWTIGQLRRNNVENSHAGSHFDLTRLRLRPLECDVKNSLASQ